MMQKAWKIIETRAHGYSSESTQRELSNENQYDRVSMVFKKYLGHCALDESSLRPSALEGFIGTGWVIKHTKT